MLSSELDVNSRANWFIMALVTASEMFGAFTSRGLWEWQSGDTKSFAAPPPFQASRSDRPCFRPVPLHGRQHPATPETGAMHVELTVYTSFAPESHAT